MHGTLRESKTLGKGKPVPLSHLFFGYLLLLIAQLFASPYLIANGLRRTLVGRHRGVGVRRFFGGVSPGTKGSIIIVGNAMGESRTALRAARDLRDRKGEFVGVWVEQIPVQRALINQDPSVFVGFSPFNNPFSAILAMLKARPKAIIFVESARYLHIAFFARLFGAKTMVANVNISERRKQEQISKPTGSYRYKLMGSVTVQSELQLQRLFEIGVPRQIVTVTGPAIYEKVSESDYERFVEKWRGLLRISEKAPPVIVAGSTHAVEEKTILKAFSDFRRRHPNAYLVLAPRYLGRTGGPAWVLEQQGTPYLLRSELNGKGAEPGVILLDTVGELREVYSIATIAFVGGSLAPEIGGHSPIEPLLWGTPVTMGPNYSQQEPAVSACLSAEVLEVCTDADTLTRAWLNVTQNADRRTEVRLRAKELLDKHRSVFDKWHETLFASGAE